MVGDLDLQELKAHSACDVMPLCVRSGQFAVADISSSSYLSLAPDWTEGWGEGWGEGCVHTCLHICHGSALNIFLPSTRILAKRASQMPSIAWWIRKEIPYKSS